MNWKHKAFLQRAFSSVPSGERLNYFIQKHVTRSLPVSDAKFAWTVAAARTHIDAFQLHDGRPLHQATFYEFGAGWDMIVPLAFYALGVDRQILVDIRRLLRLPLLADTVAKYARLPLDAGLARVPPECTRANGRSLAALLADYYGIQYKAPCDARHTGLPAGSIDCITSTDTLEHIALPSIQAILRECHRLLRDDGLLSFQINYQDHYSYFDSKITTYNFLQYSDQAWKPFSPSLQYQNRLRHRDYLNLLRGAGFTILEERREDGTDADLASLARLTLDQRFASYSLPELAVHNALIVARRPAGNRVHGQSG